MKKEKVEVHIYDTATLLVFTTKTYAAKLELTAQKKVLLLDLDYFLGKLHA